MSELHKFLFEGLPVRGMLVRLTDGWQEVLRRRESAGSFEAPLRRLLGEMSAAGVLLQSNIKFNGAVVLQVFGEGPVKLAVTEVQPDLAFRTTAKLVGELPATDTGRLPLPTCEFDESAADGQPVALRIRVLPGAANVTAAS